MSVIDRTSLVLKRTFDAPVEQVYAAWTDPDAIAQWFLGDDCQSCKVFAADVRVNGRYEFLMTHANGESCRVQGLYHEVEPNKKLVFSWALSHEPERQSLVMVEFMDQGSKTLLKLTHTRLPDPHSRDCHLKGWTSCLDHLQGWLAD
jgi:uncharacterized protein YndB with AHSA1/START domain